MRRIVSLGLTASILAFTMPAMAQDFLPRGNGGGHANSGGGYATQGGGVAGGTAAQAGGFGGGSRGFQGGGGGRRGGFGGNNYRRYGGGGYGGGYHRRGGYGGAAVGAGIAGLAAGALIGGAIANQGYGYGNDAGPGPGYYAPDVQPAPVAGDEESYCASRYRSYDPSSGTYLGYDGARHPCP